LLAVCATVAVILGGCSDHEPTPGSHATRQLLAVDVSSVASASAFSGTRVVTVPRAFEPAQSLGGDLMLLAYEGTEIVQAEPIHVPTEVRLEGPRSHRDGSVESAEGLPATFLLDLSAKLSRVELQNEQGEALASLDRRALERLRQSESTLIQPMAVDSSERTTADMEAAFPQIRFLDADAGDELPAIYDLPGSHVKELLSIDADAAAALLPALKRVPAAAISAVRSVGVATFDTDSGIVGISFGSSLLVSASLITDEKELAETVVHEATHNLQFLLDGELSTDLWNPDAWPADVRDAAEQTIAKHRLAAGVTRAWSDLHETGVDLELVDAYQGKKWIDLTDDLAGYGGFASPYGASAPGEDMAEYVGRLTVPENGGESVVCGRMRTAPAPFPLDLAVPYAKVRFLEALKLLDQGQLEACAGTPGITGPAGVHLGSDVHFTEDLKAGWLDQDGDHFLAALGAAPPYRFMLRVLAPDDAALGMHRLDDIGVGNLNDANNAVYLAHDEDDLRARTSAGGLVLVTEASPERVEGAMFLLSLRSAAGFVTDSFAISTFSITAQR
jgi:hypothetical protein